MKRYRKKTGQSQDAIGELLGFTGSYICHIEAGRKTLQFRDALKLTTLSDSNITLDDVINYAKN